MQIVRYFLTSETFWDKVSAKVPKRFGNYRMQVKLKDVARKTGFSITTVSRALAGYDDVNAETRQLIVEAAETLGYQPNQLGRQLRSQRTNTLGLILPADDHSFSDNFFTQLLLGIGDAATHDHYDLLVSAQPTGTSEEMRAYQRMVGGRRVDGIILARTRRDDERIAYLQERGHPFVVNGRRPPNEPSDFPYIDVDSQTGIRDAVRHFIDYGHREIGLILPPPEMAFTEYRHAGYREALAEAGIPYQADYVTYGNLLNSSGYNGANDLLNRCPQITAIVASNDLMAFGAIHAAQARGLHVGEDIAVCGFDDIPSTEYTFPRLTTVRQPIFEIGQQLAQMLAAIIAGQPPAETQRMLQPTLIIRESSGNRRA